MLARYKIYRGARDPHDPPPDGIRQDTRKHTNHPLRPGEEMVKTYLSTPPDEQSEAWKVFEHAYMALLNERFTEDPTPFDDLAKLAQDEEVYIGCSCPTVKNPDPSHCHTILALRFMRRKYPQLKVRFPDGVEG